MVSLPPPFTAVLTPLTLRLRDIVSFQLPRLAASSSSSSSGAASTATAAAAHTSTSSSSGTTPSLAVAASALAQFASYEAELNEALQECSDLVERGDLVVEELLDDLYEDPNQLDTVLDTEWKRVKRQYTDARTQARKTLLEVRKELAEKKKAGLLRAGRDGTTSTSTTTSARNKAGTAAAATGSGSGSRTSHSQSNRGGARVVGAGGSTGGDDAALHASSNLTTALESTLSRLSDSLAQSSYSSQLLEESTNTLETLTLDYSTFADLLRNSGGILKSMERSDRIDALMLLGAYAFFVVCVGYILKVRIWDRGVGVLMILLKIFGLRSGTASATAAAAASSTTATTLAKVATGLGRLAASPSPAVTTASSAAAAAASEAAEAVLDAVSDSLAHEQPSAAFFDNDQAALAEDSVPTLLVDTHEPTLDDVVAEVVSAQPSTHDGVVHDEL
ncbi:unnamed protein product [Parajaminaea phylloscopi]